jgi:hypothetical protein
MDHKVRTIRLWLLTLFVVALGCWEPALWFGVPLFFFPTCSCCGFACLGICNNGTTRPTMQVELTGITDGTCSECTNLNSTWVLPATSTCTWNYELGNDAICEADLTWSYDRVSLALSQVFGVGQIAARVFDETDNSTRTLSWSDNLKGTGTIPTDCDDISQTLPPGSVVFCDLSSSSAIVTSI